jgi:hypothetical protein
VLKLCQISTSVKLGRIASLASVAALPPQSDLDWIVPCTVATVAGRGKEDNEQKCARLRRNSLSNLSQTDCERVVTSKRLHLRVHEAETGCLH